jgi:hypothetical protein
MPYSCVYCHRINAFRSSSALEKHLVFCPKVPGKKKSQLGRQLSVSLPGRVSAASPRNQQKRARYQNEDSHGGSANEDDDDHGEGPSHHQDHYLQAVLPTEPIRSARSGRAIRVPQRLMDFVPHGDMSLSHVPRPTTPSSPESSPQPTTLPISIETKPNKLGVFRRYPRIPSWYPEAGQSLDSICEAPTLDALQVLPINPDMIHELYPQADPLPHEPFSSRTAAIMMEAYHDGSGQKSAAHLNALVKAMSSDPEFDIHELKNFSTERENARLDAFLRDESIEHPFRKNDGWHEASVTISVPVKGQCCREEEAPQINIPGLYHRQLMSIITTVFGDESSKGFHFTPFKQFWIPDDNNPEQTERLYSEIYTSDIAHECQQSVDASPRLEGDDLERVVIPLMFASDSTHLTSFGSASVWPIYVGFGSQTKYDRAKPSAHATHHLAYVPSVR